MFAKTTPLAAVASLVFVISLGCHEPNGVVVNKYVAQESTEGEPPTDQPPPPEPPPAPDQAVTVASPQSSPQQEPPQPAATQPAAPQPAATQPAATQPAATQPAATQTAATQTAATQPAATQPAATQTAATQPAPPAEPPAAPTPPAEPATVARVAAALRLADFPRPDDATTSFVTQTSLYYQTDQPMNSVRIGVMDELIRRGFVAGDEIRIQHATITVTIADRPMTLFLANSYRDNLTHVRMYRHQGVDDSRVPLLESNGPIEKRVDQTYYTTPIGVLEGQQILRGEINELGIPIARMSNSEGVARFFDKDGIRFVCQIEEAKTMEFETPGVDNSVATRVNITSLGNIVASDLPHPDDFTKPAQVSNSVFGSATFVTDSDAADAASRAAKTLQESGWTKVDAMRGSIADSNHLLIRGGSLVSVQATEFDSGQTYVDYYVSVRAHDLPDQIDTRLVRVDPSAPNLFFTTSAGVKPISDFYSGHLADVGWKPDPKLRLSNQDRFLQKFDGVYFQPLLLDIHRKANGSTWVELRTADETEIASLIAQSQSPDTPVASAPSPTNPADPVSASASTDDATADIAAALRTAMDDAAVPESPKQIADLARRQMERSLQNLPEDQAAEVRAVLEQSLNNAMTELGEAASTEANAQPKELETETTPAETPAEVKVPEGKIAAKDFPVPADAKDVSRDLDMISFRVDEVVKNATFIKDALTERGWKPRGDSMMESDMAMFQFQKGKGTLNVSLIRDERRSPPVRAMIHGDGLLFPNPDGGEPEIGFDGEMDDEPFPDEPQEFKGLALPNGIDSPVRSETQFRSELTTSLVSDLQTQLNYFRKTATDDGWKVASEQTENAGKAGLTLTRSDGELLVELQRYDAEVEIKLAFRDPVTAKKFGFVPEQGAGRIVLANSSDNKVTVTINGKPFELAAGQGAEDPTKGVRLNVKPGAYQYTITGPNREEQSDKLKIVVGGTWAIVVIPELGHMAERMY